jgi:hypothetical protein
VKIRKRGSRVNRPKEPKIHELSFFVDIGEELPRAVTVCGLAFDEWAEVVTRKATCSGCLEGRAK